MLPILYWCCTEDLLQVKWVLFIPLPRKCNISSQVGLVYLSVVIDLLFTVSLMLLRQLNLVLRSAFTSRKTQPECQGIPLPSALASAALPGLDRAAHSRLCVQHICWGSSWDLPGTPSLWEKNSGETAEKDPCLFQMCLLGHVPWTPSKKMCAGHAFVMPRRKV